MCKFSIMYWCMSRSHLYLLPSPNTTSPTSDVTPGAPARRRHNNQPQRRTRCVAKFLLLRKVTSEKLRPRPARRPKQTALNRQRNPYPRNHPLPVTNPTKQKWSSTTRSPARRSARTWYAFRSLPSIPTLPRMRPRNTHSIFVPARSSELPHYIYRQQTRMGRNEKERTHAC